MMGFISFTIVVTFISLCASNDLPPYFPICAIDDPDLAGCILKASNDVREYVKKGIPELDFPPVDPLVIPEIKMEQGTRVINYKVTLRNATVKGLGDYAFSDFTFDVKTLTFHGNGVFNSLSLVANYEVDGKIFLAPIQGKGALKVLLGPSSSMLDIKGELVMRNGEEHYHPTDVKSTMVIGNVTSSFDGLFEGNEELSRATNQLLKEHSDELVKEITPAIEKVAEELVRKMMLGINKNVPYNKLFRPAH